MYLNCWSTNNFFVILYKSTVLWAYRVLYKLYKNVGQPTIFLLFLQKPLFYGLIGFQC